MCTSKTPITVLQEMMMKKGQIPEYKCVEQTGPEHSASFEYRCEALGAIVTAVAKSKKLAKQEAARRMLAVLAGRGEPVPPPYCLPQAPSTSTAAAGSPPQPAPSSAQNSYVALLKDLCIEYNLPAVDYELVGDTGPPHHRMFTIRARLGQHERIATATSKKLARQQAAAQLYTYMRENLARLTKDFVEEEALVRAHERAMERYVEIKEEAPWRPDLGQRVADYHLYLPTHIEASKCELAREALEGAGGGADRAVTAAVAALGLTLNEEEMETSEWGDLYVVEVSPTLPALTFAGASLGEAYAAAAKYLRLVLNVH